MLKANALFIVIVISLAVGGLCTLLIGISYYQRLQVQKYQLQNKLEYNAVSGLNLVLADRDDVFSETEVIRDLYGEENDSVALKKQHWGIFDIVAVKAFCRNQEKIKTVLTGYLPDSKGRAAIYLVDQNRPLALAGNTLIKGDCFLPEAGVIRGYAENTTFTGTTLVQGTVSKSNFMLPELNDKIIKPIISKLESKSQDTSKVSSVLKDTVYNSFLNPTVILDVSATKRINKKVWEGNIMVVSSQPVEIDSSSRLNDIIVFAPAVTFGEGFTGSLQVFCSDSIWIKKNVFLKYPSVAGLVKTKVTTKQPFIHFGEKVVFKGILFTYCNIQDIEKTLVHIDKTARVEGQLYVDGGTDVKGTVWGNITSSKFILKTPSSLYENYLFDATIDASKLSAAFVGSSLVYSSKNKKVVKWLE